MTYQEFDDAAFSRFRRKLLRTKGGPAQREFLLAVRDDEEFLRITRHEISTRGSWIPALCPEPLTESEFKQPPASTEADLYKAWSSLTPRIACRTTFWANLTRYHIEAGRVRSSYLAANGGTLGSGRARIDRVLQESGDRADRAVDQCVRAVLRRLGGLPEARGNRSVYVDCPLARAWWRERLVHEVSEGDPECAEEVREVTRVNQTYWEELVVLVVSRNSVLGSHEVRDKFILSLANLIMENPSTPLRIAKNLRAACRMVGVIQASKELSVLAAGDLKQIMDQVLQLHHRLATNGDSDNP